MADQSMNVSCPGISALQRDTSAPPPAPSEVGAQLAQIMDFKKRMVGQLSQELHSPRVRPFHSPAAKENARRHQSHSRHESTDSEAGTTDIIDNKQDNVARRVLTREKGMDTR